MRSGVSANLLDVSFADELHGWAVGTNGAIVATADGGDSWSLQASGYSLTLHGVDFVDRRTGWAVGQLGLILHTTDGGQTWNVQDRDAALERNLIHVRFSDAKRGSIVAERGSFWLHTTDGGANWGRRFFSNSMPRADAFWLDESRGWAAFRSGELLATRDGGESWQRSSAVDGVDMGVSGVFFLDERRGWLAGWRGKPGSSGGIQFVEYMTDGMVTRTVDGGATWERVDAGTGRFLWDVEFTNASDGWAVGSFGQILRSADGGVTWTPQPSPTESLLRAIAFDETGRGWAVGDDGAILRYTGD